MGVSPLSPQAERGGKRGQGSVSDTDDVVHDRGVPEAQDTIALRSQPSIANAIVLAISVLAAIAFDDQVRFPAVEIGDVAADRFLRDELKPNQTSVPDAIPETAFHFGL
jgi:hypothetical protein